MKTKTNKITIERLHQQREELYAQRDEKTKNITVFFNRFSKPINFLSIVAEPVFKNTNWWPVAFAIGKFTYSLIKGKTKKG